MPRPSRRLVASRAYAYDHDPLMSSEKQVKHAVLKALQYVADSCGEGETARDLWDSIQQDCTTNKWMLNKVLYKLEKKNKVVRVRHWDNNIPLWKLYDPDDSSD